MPIQDKTVTLQGSKAKLTKVELWPQADGSVVMISFGSTLNGGGQPVALDEARIQKTGVSALDNCCDRGLTELRKANGLE